MLIVIYLIIFSIGCVCYSTPVFIASQSTSANSGTKLQTSSNFLCSALAGAISCSSTHSMLVPLDVVKTKLQADPKLSRMGIVGAVKSILKSQGHKAFGQGLAATSCGYFLQGACKFGFYDLFKRKIHDSCEDRGMQTRRFTLPILLCSSGFAEVVASWALCPLESTRIYMVLNSEDSKRGMLNAMKSIMKTSGIAGFFRGLPVIMMKQVPYTCVKLAGYDLIVDWMKSLVSPQDQISSLTTIQISSGVLAGILAAVISQPADVLLSKVCGVDNMSKECLIIDGPRSVVRALSDIGFQGCFRGMLPRAIMVGSMTAMQFFVYEKARLRISKIMDEPAAMAMTSYHTKK